jgi:hypothetical protein
VCNIVNRPTIRFLVELILSGYTEPFIKVFLIFIKKRFFESFVKSGSNSIVFNKYTLLRSSFVNKSSREQIEKRVYKKKINFVFSKFDFKIFYLSLKSINFKGISLKFNKYSFSHKAYKCYCTPVYRSIWYKEKKHRDAWCSCIMPWERGFPSLLLSILKFPFIWAVIGVNKKYFFIKNLFKNDIHKVFLLIGTVFSTHKRLTIKFLKLSSFYKNRVRHGLFKFFYTKPKFSFENSLVISSSISTLLSYSFGFNNMLKLSYFVKNNCLFSFKESRKFRRNNHLFSSVLRYRKYFIWSSFNGGLKSCDYRLSLTLKNTIDKFNIYSKLILSLKIGPLVLKSNKLFNKTFHVLKRKRVHFYKFLSLIRFLGLKKLTTFLSKKSLSSFLSKAPGMGGGGLFKLYERLKKRRDTKKRWVIKNKRHIKNKRNRISINLWVIKRFITRSCKNKRIRSAFLEKYERIKEVSFFNSVIVFEPKRAFIRAIYYYNRIAKESVKKKRDALIKQFKWFTRKRWGYVWKIKSKKRFFYRERKRHPWRTRHRNYKNTYQKRERKRFLKRLLKKREFLVGRIKSNIRNLRKKGHFFFLHEELSKLKALQGRFRFKRPVKESFQIRLKQIRRESFEQQGFFFKSTKIQGKLSRFYEGVGDSLSRSFARRSKLSLFRVKSNRKKF